MWTNKWIRFCLGVLIGIPTVLILLWLVAMLFLVIGPPT